MRVYKDGKIVVIKINKEPGKKYRKWGNHDSKVIVAKPK